MFRIGVSMSALMMMGTSVALPQASPPANPGQKFGNSPNITLVSHVQLAEYGAVTDLEIEQELSRPYAYVARRFDQPGFAIISLKEPRRAHVIYNWHIENPEIHQGRAGMDAQYFKTKGRYYYVQAMQFGQSGPDWDLGAVITDVTSLPDTSGIKEAGRIREPEAPNGFHNTLMYKHSDGRVLLFATSGPQAKIYDMDKFLAGDGKQGRIGQVPVLDAPNGRGTYHDFSAAYDPATKQDKFYGAAWESGFYIFDITRPEEPKLITSITGHAGAGNSHTFTPTPDGRYAVVESEYQYAPLKIFDLKPGLDGTVKTISRPIGAWTADWRALSHNHEVRWPYVFVSGYEDGLQVFNMMDPTNPYTVGYYYTCQCPHKAGVTFRGPARPPNSGDVDNGAWGVDVRNADGLVVISDKVTGFWAFHMEGFDGWNGHQWGLPNISSAQDWDNGPEGAAKPQKVS
jgi:hypothetical protein